MCEDEDYEQEARREREREGTIDTLNWLLDVQSVAELSKRTGVSKSTIYRGLRRGRLSEATWQKMEPEMRERMDDEDFAGLSTAVVDAVEGIDWGVIGEAMQGVGAAIIDSFSNIDWSALDNSMMAVQEKVSGLFAELQIDMPEMGERMDDEDFPEHWG